MPAKDTQLATMMKQAKSSPRNFVLAFNGSKISIFLTKKKISGGMPAAMKQELGGGKVVTGVVSTEGSTTTFKSLDDIPEKLKPIIKGYIKDEAGITVSPKVEKVDSLVEVDEETVVDTGSGGDAMSKVDVDGRIATILPKLERQFRDELDAADVNRATYQEQIDRAEEAVAKNKAASALIKSELAAASKASPQDATAISGLTARAKSLVQLGRDLGGQRIDAKGTMKQFEGMIARYTELMRQYDGLGTNEEKYAMLDPGAGSDITTVRTNMKDAMDASDRSLAILGRTSDTIFGDDSWVNTHKGQEGRVLNADNWSMAVNDAFVKAGLDQKADFAMITKFQDAVLAKVKELLMNPGARTKEELKKELRTFVRSAADPALFTGGSHNDGFAVSMIELEQLIDDGYVMMQHDPDGKEAAGGTGAGSTQVMVPSGTGQKIKAELAEKADIVRRKQLQASLKSVIVEHRASIAKSDELKRLVAELGVLVKSGDLDEATSHLSSLNAKLV